MSFRSAVPVWVAAVVLGLFCTAQRASGQQADMFDEEAEKKGIALANEARAQANLPQLAVDRRLTDAARLHAMELGKYNQLSHQFPGEPNLRERLSLAGAPIASAGEICVIAPSVEKGQESVLESAPLKAVLLEPKYSAIGVGVLRRGEQLFIVSNLAQPLAKISVDEAEKLVAESVQQLRISKKLMPFARKSMPQLRKDACDMAKRDTVKAKTHGAPNVRGPNAYSDDRKSLIFSYTTLQPAQLPPDVLRMEHEPNVNTFSVGACFERSDSYPEGRYWVVALFYWTKVELR